MAEKRLVRTRVPSGGLCRRGRMTARPDNTAPTLTNALLVAPGYVSRRGPLTRTAIATKGGRAIGGVPFGTRALVGHITSNTANEFGVLPTDAQIVPGNRYVTSTAATDITATTDKNVTPLNRHSARFGSLAFYLSVTTTGAAQQAVYGTTNINKRRVVSWDGSLATTIMTNGPSYAIDISGYAERVFVLGGVPPGGGTFDASVLYYSDANGPTADTAAMWQDDVSSVVNKIVVGQSDPSDYGVALAPISNGLAVLKRRSIWVLRGSGSQTFQMRKFAGDVGCTSTESVVPWRDGVLFMSETGVMYFDGSQLVAMSENVIWRGSPFLAESSSGGVLATPLGREHFLFQQGLTYYVLNATSRAWTTFDFGLLFEYIPLFTLAGDALVVDDRSVWDGALLARVDETNTISSTEKDYAGTDTVITMEYGTRLLPIGAVGEKAQVHRVMVDYDLRVSGATTSSSILVSASNASAAGVLTSIFDSGAQTIAANTGGIYAGQKVFDSFNEAENVFVTMIASGFAGETISAMNIGDVYVEYQPTRQRV